jgi:carbamoyltransferase
MATKDLIERAANKLMEGKILGVLRGRSECGPRALCHRSILASPITPSMKIILNQKVKYRETF